MTLSAYRCSLPPTWVALALALAIVIPDAATAQDATAPSPGDPPEADIQELREAIRRLKERVAAFSGDQTATAAMLQGLRTDAVDQIKAIDRMQRDLGIEPPPEDTASPALAAENQKLRKDLEDARRETDRLKAEHERRDARHAEDREAAAARIRQLEGSMTIAGAEIGDLRNELAKAETLAAEAKSRRDPADIARLQQAKAEIEAGTAEIDRLHAEGETLRADLQGCARARDDALRRAALPEAMAWQALRTENQTLLAENAANDQRVNDAMAIAERCVGQTSGKDDRLGQALREIEALEAALARERAANR
jgi:chromosome segregation ATPase